MCVCVCVCVCVCGIRRFSPSPVMSVSSFFGGPLSLLQLLSEHVTFLGTLAICFFFLAGRVRQDLNEAVNSTVIGVLI